MRFWDASAVVSLCLQEPGAPSCFVLLKEDPVIVVWWGTRTECLSSFAHKLREGILTRQGEGDARHVLAGLMESWVEIEPRESVRRIAERLLQVHPLRAGDAFQLAASLEWSGPDAGRPFVCLDRRLAEAARKEGFGVLP